MKVFLILNNYLWKGNTGEPGWVMLADSAVSNTGKPFYLPENVGRTMASISAVIRISRLGKSVSKKFADRYYAEYAPAVHFSLPDLAEKLKEKGLPVDPAHSFDKSLIVGNFKSINPDDYLELEINGKVVVSFLFRNLCFSLEELIPIISRMNTIKMGDLVIPGLSEKTEIKEGDFMEVKIGNESAFHIRVK